MGKRWDGLMKNKEDMIKEKRGKRGKRIREGIDEEERKNSKGNKG